MDETNSAQFFRTLAALRIWPFATKSLAIFEHSVSIIEVNSDMQSSLVKQPTVLKV